jgi:hypothetical protein
LNTDLLLRIADAIERRPDKFNMDFFLSIPSEYTDPNSTTRTTVTAANFFDCDAVACVAGWACLLIDNFSGDHFDVAAEALGIECHVAYTLFYPSENTFWGQFTEEFGWDWSDDDGYTSWACIEPKQAAEVLRRLARGEVTL